ncbi:MAG: hypothetical protein ACKO2Z_03105, partial [Sphaerospermopsis kisseleviana]
MVISHWLIIPHHQSLVTSHREHPNFDKINAATLKNLSQSLTFVSFASFAVQSYQVLEHFISLDKNKFT